MRFGKGADATSDVRDMRTGGRGPMSLPGGAKGAGGIVGVVMLVVVALISRSGGGGGTDLTDILSAGFPQAQAAPAGQDGIEGPDPDADLREFAGQVFNDAQDMWIDTFEGSDRDYRRAQLVLFDSPVQSGCGGARAEIGPHYCPADDTVYLELGFFRQLASELDAPGDFAQAYVIAHELGHHVQNVLGTSEEVAQLQREDPGRANGYSIRLELQSDCYAGVWARTVYDRGLLDPGDVEEGLTAAEGVGDDRIQERATGRVDPESWNHGSSAQRQRWFRTGFDGGRADGCDTFSVQDP